jgi:23S rRNA pseudouridine2605 synthase
MQDINNKNNNNNTQNMERIAKRIANAGVCSRREAEKLILEKKVMVNDSIITTPAFLVGAKDKIVVNGVALKHKQKLKLFAYYKPKGLICSNADEAGRETIFDDLKRYDGLPRVVYVGRLDYNSEGLLLLSTSGELSNTLCSPSLEIKRTYKVRAFGSVSQKDLDTLAMGVEIEGVKYRPVIASIINRSLNNVWMEFTLQEGKNREIRKICEYLGLQVSRLIRVSFGPYKLLDLKEGDIMEVDIMKLKNILPRGEFEKIKALGV